MKLFSLSLSLLSVALIFSSAIAQTPAAKPSGKLKTLSYSCRVLYEPSRSLWVRELEIDYDSKAFQALRVDGVRVHGFATDGVIITTHLDNERIELDMKIPQWKSQFREAAQGQGVCVKNR
jgi:hypothetical protein